MTNYNDNNISVVNTVSDTVTATMLVRSYPYEVAVTPDGTKVYVANWISNNVSVIDTATNTITNVPVGYNPRAFGKFIGGNKRLLKYRCMAVNLMAQPKSQILDLMAARQRFLRLKVPRLN